MPEWIRGTVTGSRVWNDRLYSLRFSADLAPFKAGQFVRVGLDCDGERVGRPYSLVNAPDERPLEIYFNIVEEGPLTPRLAEMQAGDELWVAPKASGLLTVEDAPEVPHLWMMATGTAIGPFLSILKDAAAWERFERVVLVHGVRTHDELTYGDTVREMLARHGDRLDFVPFVSREAPREGLAGRIPAAITDGRLEARVGLALGPEQSHVMLCGNSGMIEDVSGVLGERGMKRHRRRDPGHISTEKYH
jgi:ferredoxin--NADP+ reductase